MGKDYHLFTVDCGIGISGFRVRQVVHPPAIDRDFRTTFLPYVGLGRVTVAAINEDQAVERALHYLSCVHPDTYQMWMTRIDRSNQR